MRRLLIFLVVIFSLISGHSFAQLYVRDSLTAQQYVENVLLGAGITVSNVTFNGAPLSMGFFRDGSQATGFKKGLILTSGDIINAVGPNQTGSSSTCTTYPGDVDLDLLLAPTGFESYDACVLEFDFVPLSDTVKFRYAFGSEEYPEFVGSYNDVFGFFLSGPGIAGPYSNGAENIALFEDAVGNILPVAINDLNCQNNSPQYVCNDPFNFDCVGYNCPASPADALIQYDGYTVPLTALYKVTPCSTYHIKLAIADGGDCGFDSGVFLEGGSFSGGLITINGTAGAEVSDTNQTDQLTIVEGCEDITVRFAISSPKTKNDTVYYQLSGSADSLDYTLYPDTLEYIVIPAGETFVDLQFYPIPDGVEEVDEDIKFIVSKFVCNNEYRDSLTIKVINVNPLKAHIVSEEYLCKGESITIRGESSGGFGKHYYSWSGNHGTDTSITVIPEFTKTYYLNVGDSCGSIVSDSIKVWVEKHPVADFKVLGNGCTKQTAVVEYTGTDNEDYATFEWNFGDARIKSGEGKGPYAIEFDTPGEKKITLQVFNRECESNLFEYTYAVKACQVEIPNVFTPNGDGSNDKLTFFNLENYPENTLVIYNRWGRKVYETESYKNSWDAEGVEDGVYYYILDIRGEVPLNQEGVISIFR